MRYRDWHHTAGPKDESLPAGLLNGIQGFGPDAFRRSKQHALDSTQSAADHPGKSLQALSEVRLGRAVVPVDDLHRIAGKLIKHHVFAVQMQHV